MRSWQRFVVFSATVLLVLGEGESFGRPPNVLFIAIDYQNDWVGHLGGHPLVKTPHLDALAARGTTFTNAHCQAPLCNPSRASLLVGLRPSTTGIYGLAPSFRAVPAFAERLTLPQYFVSHGYRTAGDGKIFHQGTRSGGKGSPADFQETGGHGGVGDQAAAEARAGHARRQPSGHGLGRVAARQQRLGKGRLRRGLMDDRADRVGSARQAILHRRRLFPAARSLLRHAKVV